MPNTIGRRAALKLPLAGAAAALGCPIIGHAAQNTLRYVPYSNLIVLDPVWAISIIGLEHAYMTCDQLYGLDEAFVVQPQMAAGHELSADNCAGASPFATGWCSTTAIRWLPPIAWPRSTAGPGVTLSVCEWQVSSTR